MSDRLNSDYYERLLAAVPDWSRLSAFDEHIAGRHDYATLHNKQIQRWGTGARETSDPMEWVGRVQDNHDSGNWTKRARSARLRMRFGCAVCGPLCRLAARGMKAHP